MPIWKNEVVCSKGFQFNFGPNKQTYGWRELENCSNEDFISCSCPWSSNVGIWDLHKLFVSLRVLNNLTMHWFDFASWILIEFMHIQVKNDIVKAIQFVQFIALSSDEVTTIDNGWWICVHLYVIDCWTRVPILVCLIGLWMIHVLTTSLKLLWMHCWSVVVDQGWIF